MVWTSRTKTMPIYNIEKFIHLILLRWSFLKPVSMRRLWTPCFTRPCHYRTTPCWRPHVGATPTVALTARKRRGPVDLSFASVSVESTSRDTARTTTGHWDTETDITNRHAVFRAFRSDGEHSSLLMFTCFSFELFHSHFLYHYLDCGLDVIASDLLL